MNVEKALTLTEMAISDNSRLFELKKYLQDVLSEQIAKEKGGQTEKNRFTVAKKYIANSIKINTNKSFHGIWYNDNKEYQYISNSHSAFKLISHIEGLPELPDDIQKPKIEEVFKGLDKHTLAILPNIADLKLQYKMV